MLPDEDPTNPFLAKLKERWVFLLVCMALMLASLLLFDGYLPPLG